MALIFSFVSFLLTLSAYTMGYPRLAIALGSIATVYWIFFMLPFIQFVKLYPKIHKQTYHPVKQYHPINQSASRR